MCVPLLRSAASRPKYRPSRQAALLSSSISTEALADALAVPRCSMTAVPPNTTSGMASSEIFFITPPSDFFLAITAGEYRADARTGIAESDLDVQSEQVKRRGLQGFCNAV